MSGDPAGATAGQQASGQQATAEQVSWQRDTEPEPGTRQQGPEPGTGQEGPGREPGTVQQGPEPEPGTWQEDPGQQGTGQQHTGQAGSEQQPTAERLPGEQGISERAWRQPGRAGWDVPWAESPAAGAGPQERTDLEVAFAAALRRTGSLMQLMGQAAAERIGINSTDLNCLNLLSFSGHMTAGELARATGLTTASITGVIDRLEEAGFVRRERDPHDRRRVVVQLVLDKALREVASVFLPMIRAWREMAARYSDDELRLIVDFYGRMEQVLRDHLDRLRDG
jgi:DNA-binding MarR family transcriptional regulator